MLTAGYDDPDKVHGHIINPEIVCFRTTVIESFVIGVKHVRRIV